MICGKINIKQKLPKKHSHKALKQTQIEGRQKFKVFQTTKIPKIMKILKKQSKENFKKNEKTIFL